MIYILTVGMGKLKGNMICYSLPKILFTMPWVKAIFLCYTLPAPYYIYNNSFKFFIRLLTGIASFPYI